jgi:pilus assembly protein CpaE
MSELIVIEPDSALAERIGTALAARADVDFRVVSSVDPKVLADQDLQVIVVGPGVPQADSLEFARGVSEVRPNVGTLLVAENVSTELLRLALRSGLSDVVAAPEGDLAELQAAFDAVLQRSMRTRVPAGVGSALDAARHATVITVLSTKGGVGKSILASNIAVSLAELGKNTVLVDLDLRSGDLGIMLGLKPERTIAGAAMDCDHLDEEMLRGFLVDHSSGLHVLLAPSQPDDAALVSAPRLSRILDLLVKMCDVIIIDTSPIIDDVILTAVDKSDLVYLVVTMDVASVKDARLDLHRLESLGYSAESVRLMLNRADSRVFLDPGDVETAVGLRVYARIPSDRLVSRSVNKGVPVVIEAPRSAVAKSLAGIARMIAGNGGSS